MTISPALFSPIRTLIIIVSLLFATGNIKVYAHAPSGPDSLVMYYNGQAKKYLDAFKFDESMACLQKAQAIKENALSYCFLCHIYGVQNRWEEAVAAGEKCVAMNPEIQPVYPDLLVVEMKMNRWDQAQDACEKILKYYPKENLSASLAAIESGKENDSRSFLFKIVLMCILLAAFAIPIYTAGKNSGQNPAQKSLRFIELLLAGLSISALLWLIFFALSKWIWSQNPHVNFTDFTTIISVTIYEHDGSESFVLYAMMFVNIACTIGLVSLLHRLNIKRSAYFAIYLLLFALSCWYIWQIGFYPPIVTLPNSGEIAVVGTLLALCAGLYFLYLKQKWIAVAIMILIFAYASLIPYTGSNQIDLELILAPGLRLLNGFKITQIYFQYDIFMSLLAALWFKLGLNIDFFPYLGNVSFFLFMLGACTLSVRLFNTKGLFVVFMLAMTIMRIYAQSFDSLTVLQVTPLRLDLWIIVLLLANAYGYRHWSVGISLGLLIIFHRNLGLIYAIGYMQLLIILFLADTIPLLVQKQPTKSSFIDTLCKHARGAAINLSLLLIAVGCCFVFFHELFSVSAVTYRKLGMGMLPISRTSFYWYVPAILSSTVLLLIIYRSQFREKYFTTGLFMVLIAIGNSMYFFGRSHENGILNICGILVFVLFLLFDMLIVIHKKEDSEADDHETNFVSALQQKYLNKQSIYLLLPVVFVLCSGFLYADRIKQKAFAQYKNLSEGRFSYPLFGGHIDTDAIDRVTNNSPKVYFFDLWSDFYCYYYCKKPPLGYFSPCYSWIYKKDLLHFVQGLLDSGYCIVYDRSAIEDHRAYIAAFDYNDIHQENSIASISKWPVPHLLPPASGTLWDIAPKDRLTNDGIYHKPLPACDVQTIEAIISPADSQVDNATILNNMNRVANIDNTTTLTGFTLQLSGNTPNLYFIGVSNGAETQNVSFQLEPYKWNYLVVTVSKTDINVYDNGKQVASESVKKPLVLNSDATIVMGNGISGNRPFMGIIKEVRIRHTVATPSEIATTMQYLQQKLQ